MILMVRSLSRYLTEKDLPSTSAPELSGGTGVPENPYSGSPAHPFHHDIIAAMSGEKFLTVPAFERVPRLVHGFGTRAFGLPALRRFAADRGLSLILLDQVHSGDIAVVRSPHRPDRRTKADALATDCPGLLLAVKTADCLPILLVDPERRAAAAVHAGWRGTRSRIAGRAADVLISRFGCRPRAILAAFGPCIGPSCYEVGEDVREAFESEALPLSDFRPSPSRPGAFFLDLAGANRRQLLERGLSARRIFVPASCTHCDDRLLSFRRDRDRTARLYDFIGFRPA
jgi:YfiH family protein